MDVASEIGRLRAALKNIWMMTTGDSHLDHVVQDEAAKALRASPVPDPTWHVVVTHGEDGAVHVQHVGPDHVLPESLRVIDLPAGVTVLLRKLPQDLPS